MRKVYHSDQERHEARRAYDHNRTVSYERQERRPNPRNKPRLAPTQEGYRVCNDCGEKPLSEFHFRNGKPLAVCITCERARDRERNRLRRVRKTPEKPKATKPKHKVCNTCLIEKPHADFQVNKQQKDGYDGRCKQCKSERYHASPEKIAERKVYNDAYRIANGEQLRAYDRARYNTDAHRAKRRSKNAIKRETRLLKQQSTIPPLHKARPLSLFKICTQCKQEKFLSEYSADKKRPDGHAVVCRECISVYHRSRSRDRRVYESKRRLDPEYKALTRQTNRKWRHRNKLRIQGYQLQRLARKKGASIVHRVSFVRILERDGRHCYICDKPIQSHHPLVFDHVIPLIPRPGDPQGTHTEDNIKPAHRECNARKSNRPLSSLTDFDRRGVE